MSIDLRLGDCLEVMGDLPDGSIDAVITDPPYGARRPSAWRSADERFAEIANNDRVHAEWLAHAFRVLKDGGGAYVFACWDKLEEWRVAMSTVGFRVRSCIVWDKGIHGLADIKTCWAPRHELILFAAKGRHVLKGKRPVDIIQAQRVHSASLSHPYQKPTSVIAPMIEASTLSGQLVLDPFMGSGTTGVACLNAGRHFIGIERDPGYFAIAERRLAESQSAVA